MSGSTRMSTYAALTYGFMGHILPSWEASVCVLFQWVGSDTLGMLGTLSSLNIQSKFICNINCGIFYCSGLVILISFGFSMSLTNEGSRQSDPVVSREGCVLGTGLWLDTTGKSRFSTTTEPRRLHISPRWKYLLSSSNLALKD